jgi:RNA polymerase sigma-70 factor (ECF subfamily)
MQGLQPLVRGDPRLAEEQRPTDVDDSFSALVHRQSRFAFRVAYAVLRNVEDAEDAVQEAFLKLFRTRAWDRPADERAFLARAVWRVAVDRRSRGTHDSLTADPAAGEPNPEELAISTNWSGVVHRLVDALPEELRQPLALSTVEELSSAEIARILGIPEGTVRTRLMRARQMLKDKLVALRRRDAK